CNWFIYWLYRFIVYEICVLYGFVRNLYSHRVEILECLVLIDHYFYRQFKNENALLFHCVHPSLGLTFIILQAEQVISYHFIFLVIKLKKTQTVRNSTNIFFIMN